MIDSCGTVHRLSIKNPSAIPVAKLKISRSLDSNTSARKVQRKNVGNHVDMVRFKGTMTKWPVKNT